MEAANSTVNATFVHSHHHQPHSSHHQHHHYILPFTTILMIVIPIFITISLIAIFLLIVMLRRLKSHRDRPRNRVITNTTCMFIHHSTINIGSSPDVKGGCLYGASSGRMAAGKLRGVQVFTYKELQVATDSFSDAKVIGRGGSGVVYRGVLGDGAVAAIKMLHSHREGKQGERAFRLEVSHFIYCQSPLISSSSLTHSSNANLYTK